MELNTNNSSVTICTSGSGATISSSPTWNPYGHPYLVRTDVFCDRIELIYRADSNITLTSWPPQTPAPRIFKMVYPFKPEEVTQEEGKLIAPKPESYDFEK